MAVGSTRRVRGVHHTKRVLTTIRRGLTERVGPKVSALSVSQLKRRVVHKCKYVPSFGGCYKCPTSVYISMGRRIIRKVPASREVVGRKSVIDLSTKIVCRNCRSSTTEAITIKRIDRRTGLLVRQAERSFVRKVGGTITKGRLCSVSTTVNSCTGRFKCKIIRSLYKRKVNDRLRRRPRVPGFERSQFHEKVGLGPKVALTIRPVVGIKAGSML